MGENLAERGLKLSLPKKRVHPYLFRSEKECIPICSASEKECTPICSVPKECRPICSDLKNDAGQHGPHLYLSQTQRVANGPIKMKRIDQSEDNHIHHSEVGTNYELFFNSGLLLIRDKRTVFFCVLVLFLF